MEKLYKFASDLYVAEDDIWKIYNTFAEFDTYKNAYTNGGIHCLVEYPELYYIN